MVIYIISFSEQGKETGNRLIKALEEFSFPKTDTSGNEEYLRPFLFKWREENTSLHDFVGEAFQYHLPLLFIGAAGIAVRAIAPFVQDKTIDSPVLVMDDRGNYVIPILSGHLGGANDLAGVFSAALRTTPVFTTASDVNHCFSADVFARRNGLAIRNREGIRKVADKALSGKTIEIAIAPRIQVTADHIPNEIHIEKYPENFGKETFEPEKTDNPKGDSEDVDQEKTTFDIVVSERKPSIGSCLLWLSPKTIVVGMGCRRGKTFEELNSFFLERLEQLFICGIYGKGQEADNDNKEGIFSESIRYSNNEKDAETFVRQNVRVIATIDRKADEEGLQILAQYWHVPLLAYSAEELGEVKGDFSESEFVREITGVSNVCERAAVRAAANNSSLLMKKQKGDGITLAFAEGKAEIHTFDTEPIFSHR